MERQHDFVLYEADPTPTTCSKRCLRQADRILLVGDTAARPGLSPIEASLLLSDGLAPRELVLVHPRGAARPTDTSAWLAPRDVVGHHQLRRGSRPDYERVARFMSGRATGLVLGGGGARGATHLGVIRALEEAGIPIDLVGGSSVGSVMAGLYAMGWDHETRVGKLVNGYSARWAIEPTLPLVSLSSAHRMEQFLLDGFGRVRIEDLWTRYFCVSVNLSRAEQVVHERGEAWRAMRASTSIPGLFPPVWSGGDLLVDGGTLNNLPVDVMRARVGDTGRVIAVDLRQNEDLRTEEPFEPALSGWGVLGRRFRLHARAPQIPSLVALVTRAGGLSSARDERERLAAAGVDLHLRPPTGGCRTLDFKLETLHGLVGAGYRYAKEQLRHQVSPWRISEATDPWSLQGTEASPA